jgi:TRAP-type C4-dicarboxylate transport system permease small subunit
MFRKMLVLYARIITVGITVMMLMLMISVALLILGRYVPFIPRMLWTEEVSRFSLIWVISLGSMLGVREGRHFFVDLLPKNLSPAVESFLRVLYYALMYVITAVFIIFGYRFFMMGYIQHSEMTGLNLGAIYVSVPLSGVTWALFLSENLYLEFFAGAARGGRG